MQTTRRARSAQTSYGLAALIVLLILGLPVYLWLGWDFYWVWLVVVNLVTFAFYRYDKRLAQRQGATRVPEVILLALLIGGGVLGGAAAMLMRPRHKTRKPAFWIVLCVAAALHAYLFYSWALP